MPQKTLNGEDIREEDNFWSEGSFIESVSPEEMKQKECTIHMKHNEEMNYNCMRCSTKISVHNKDWHAGRCDKCFDRMVDVENDQKRLLLVNGGL